MEEFASWNHLSKRNGELEKRFESAECWRCQGLGEREGGEEGWSWVGLFSGRQEQKGHRGVQGVACGLSPSPWGPHAGDWVISEAV